MFCLTQRCNILYIENCFFCPTSWVHSFSFWLWWRSWLSLSAIFLRDSVSSCSLSDMASVSSCSFLFSWKTSKQKKVKMKRSANPHEKDRSTRKERQSRRRNIIVVLTSSSLSMFARRQGTHDRSSLFSSSSCCSLRNEHKFFRDNENLEYGLLSTCSVSACWQ